MRRVFEALVLSCAISGGSDYAYELCRRAGVDPGQPALHQALTRRMDRIIDEIEVLLRTAG